MRFYVASLLLVLAGNVWAERPAARKEADRLRWTADIVVNYSIEEKLDICVGVFEVVDGARVWKQIDFALEELKAFFALQRHKDLIVIVLDKRWMGDDRDKKIAEIVDTLTGYFFAAGYKRVVIEQGLSYGRLTHSDKTNPQQSGPASRPSANP